MKIRNGFVSNSSSSSFICDVCGRTEGGFDACLSDFDMVECENGHTFCSYHQIDFEPSKEDIRNYFIRNGVEPSNYRTVEENDNIRKFLVDCNDASIDYDLICEIYYGLTDETGGTDAKHCPICMMQSIKDEEGFSYLLKKCGLTKTTLLQKIKSEFDNYRDFQNFMLK